MATVFYDFRPIVYRATLAKRSTSRRSESVTPSVCLSIRPTAKLVYGIETAKYITKHFSRSGSPVIRHYRGRLPWQPDGIKFTQCDSDQKKSAFSPLQEKLCVGSKNDWHLLELSRRSLSACKVWGDRTTRAGCRSENWYFLYVTLGLPARGGHSSNKYCETVYGSILMRFSALF